jgi:hypothetical protein
MRFLFLFLCAPFVSSTLTDFHIGGLFNLFDTKGVQVKEAILLALSEINDKADGQYDDILPNTKIKFAFESPGTKVSTAAIAASQLSAKFGGQGIRACVGPGSNAGIEGS